MVREDVDMSDEEIAGMDGGFLRLTFVRYGTAGCECVWELMGYLRAWRMLLDGRGMFWVGRRMARMAVITIWDFETVGGCVSKDS